jgi:NitT/TauT family transport system substrate-binding protein
VKLLKLGIVIGALTAGAAATAAEPVHITYGYHPYWTGGWNGVIIKEKELWKKYLPEGSTVRFEPHLTGPPMVNAMLANKMQIGTMGDMPSLVATTKHDIADIRLVSTPMFSKGQNCNKILVPTSAPQFNNVDEAMKWLNGKPFAVHRGTCTNRFMETLIRQNVVKPSTMQSMTIEVIASNLAAGKLKGGTSMWEPHARRAVEAGHARYVATGAVWNEWDADFTLMRQDFIEQHPEAAVGWLKAEVEALQFMINNPRETVEILFKEMTGYSKATIWAALYEENPERIGGFPVNYEARMVFDNQVLDLMRSGYKFLNELKVVKSPDMPQNAYNDGPIQQALKELNLSAPVGQIEGRPRSENPFLLKQAAADR